MKTRLSHASFGLEFHKRLRTGADCEIPFEVTESILDLSQLDVHLSKPCWIGSQQITTFAAADNSQPFFVQPIVEHSYRRDSLSRGYRDLDQLPSAPRLPLWLGQA